jgi:hypothetical protein
MARTVHRSRIHLLAARDAPIVVVLQRKRAKLFHIVTINTETHQVSEGSWFRGVLYGLQSDVSFDGQYMVYLARGNNRETWSGVCRLPWLKTLVHVETPLTGGGYFAGPKDLRTHGWDWSEHVISSDDIPFSIKRDEKRHFGYELAVIYGRFERDGFVRLGDSWGEEQEFTTPRFHVVCTGDDGWGCRPNLEHPELKVRYTGFYQSAFRFEFSLEAYSHLIDGASWVTWDSRRNLWVAQPGIVAQYTLDDLRNGTPSYSLDVDQFEPPAQNRSPRIDSGLLRA